MVDKECSDIAHVSLTTLGPEKAAICPSCRSEPVKTEFRSRMVKRVRCTSGVPSRLLIYYGYYFREAWPLVPRHGNLRSCCFWFGSLWLKIFRWSSKFQLWLVCAHESSNSAPGVFVHLLHLCFSKWGKEKVCLVDLWSQDHTPNLLCSWAECKLSNSLFLRWDVRWPYFVRLAWKRLGWAAPGSGAHL